MPTNIGMQGISLERIARIGQEDVERLSQHKLAVGDIVFSRRGDVTKNALVRETESGWLCGTGCLKVRMGAEKMASAQFVSYYLRLPEIKDWLIRHAVGATMPNLNTAILAAVPVILPSLPVQHQVTEFLRALDDRITLLCETNKTLESIAQAIFKSWFVDFDPVRAKMEGRQPEGMDEEIAALFPDSFEESELRLIPRGWKAGSLDELSVLNPESWTAKNHPEKILYADLANTKNNVMDGLSEFTFEDAPSRARRVLRSGDTIVGTVRPGNRSFAFVHSELENLTGSTGFAVLRPRAGAAAEFIYLSATQDSSIEYLTHVADGGAYPAVRPDVVSNMTCVLPSEEILKEFHDAAILVFKSVANNQMGIQKLSALRDMLLPRLVSGQLRLPEAHQQVEVATS